MKQGVFVLFFIGLLSLGKAQGNLQFNQALLLDSALATVPANKVWKITAVSGSEYRLNECVNISANSNHELKSARCGFATTTASFIANYSVSAFVVNNKRIINSVEGLPSQVTLHNVSNCTNGNWSSINFVCANRATTPNILPMWLPAGTTLMSGGPNTVLSVLEFNIVP
jgi:hypothetical protein